MKINYDKVPLKYVLGLYQEIAGYPTQTDLEFALATALEEKGLMTSDFLAEQVWPVMKYHLGTIAEVETLLEELSKKKRSGDLKLEKVGKRYKLIYLQWT